MTRGIGPGEAARRLGVSTRTVQRWLRDGTLAGVRVGTRIRVDERALGEASRADVPAANPGRPIRRLLVANRGELVVRIARTCDRLGVRCLALVTEDQAEAWWARAAHERVPLRGTYLDRDAVLRAATGAGADAVHPGYGFLAEDPAFAEAVVASGLAWVGPPPGAMRALGDKQAGRRLAAHVGVPVLDGYDGDAQDDETLAREAERIGYPVLLKPSAGGGGKGMHVVRAPDELEEALPRARREGRTAFGDDRLVLERYVERPRHVEVQVLLDAHGGGVHLGERDCSLQRRHQKVVEESPSPAVDGDLRERLGDAALRLARAAGYVGAGTAEFLLDDDGAFTFLEVNARLQVEHPVSELVTGRDLVADQLRIAAGEPLGFTQADVRFEGHAIEARLYAEDPWEGFLPAAGEVAAVRWPEGDGLRVDAGVGAGDVVGTRYDPLLAKVLAHGADRTAALDRLRAALDDVATLGVTSNRGFLAAMLDADAMRAGEARTDLIERIWRPGTPEALDDLAFGVAAHALRSAGAHGTVPAGWRLNAPSRVRVLIGPDERTAESAEAVDATRWTVRDGTAVVDVEGRAYRATVAPAPTVEAAVSHAQGSASHASAIPAPMPGQVLSVRVTEGDAVEAGATLLVLEAMKMENAVTAPSAGRVARLLVEPGRQVQRGEVLLELE